MKFAIRFGVPEMQELWERLSIDAKEGTLSGSDATLYKRLAKAVLLLEANPRYPGLQSHEIEVLSRRYGRKVWQSYLQNNTPAAGRIFWVYGQGQGDITIIGVEPHPEDATSRGYERVQLSDLPPQEKSEKL